MQAVKFAKNEGSSTMKKAVSGKKSRCLKRKMAWKKMNALKKKRKSGRGMRTPMMRMTENEVVLAEEEEEKYALDGEIKEGFSGMSKLSPVSETVSEWEEAFRLRFTEAFYAFFRDIPNQPGLILSPQITESENEDGSEELVESENDFAQCMYVNGRIGDLVNQRGKKDAKASYRRYRDVSLTIVLQIIGAWRGGDLPGAFRESLADLIFRYSKRTTRLRGIGDVGDLFVGFNGLSMCNPQYRLVSTEFVSIPRDCPSKSFEMVFSVDHLGPSSWIGLRVQSDPSWITLYSHGRVSVRQRRYKMDLTMKESDCIHLSFQIQSRSVHLINASTRQSVQFNLDGVSLSPFTSIGFILSPNGEDIGLDNDPGPSITILDQFFT